MSNPKIDIAGHSFGRLTAIEFAGAYGVSKASGWWCRCACGVLVIRSGNGLRLGQTLSCGCLKREKLIARNEAGLTVNTKSAQYQHWRAMVRRCHDDKAANYQNYGAKGVAVCERWRYSYEAFVQDMGKRPVGMSLDRIDGTKGYSPENCRWASAKTQGGNRSNVPLVSVNGVLMTYPDACAHYGISYVTFKNRTNTLGWSVDAALKTPVNAQRSVSVQ